jgi:hypothetical protein
LVAILAFTLLSERSTLEDEFERLKLDVWLVVILALTLLRERSTLLDELERFV